jgi:hypothetical protein
VIAGLAIGAAYLALWLWAEPRVCTKLAALPCSAQVALAVLLPLLALVLLPGEDTATAMGAAIGMGVGAQLERRTLGFSEAGKAGRRLLRGALGLALVLAAYLGLSVSFGLAHPEGAVELAWRALRYALVGLAGAWGAPWVFVQVGLAAGKEDRRER